MIAISGGNVILRRRPCRGDRLALPEIHQAQTVIRFVIPFFALLSRGAKMNANRLLWVSGLLLIGQFLDLYWLIMPQIHTERPLLGWQELGPPLLLLGIMTLFTTRFLSRHRPVPVGDPLLKESMQFYI